MTGTRTVGGDPDRNRATSTVGVGSVRPVRRLPALRTATFELFCHQGQSERADRRGQVGHLIYIFTTCTQTAMQLVGSLVREPGEHPLPPEMLVASPRPRGRPRKEYRPRVRSDEDVERLRRHGVPAFLLTSEWVTRSGYPVDFPPWLVLPRELSSKISSEFRILPVRDEAALREPGLVELVTLLLRFDPLAARVVAQRNRNGLDRHELYRRVRNEGLERAATKVRLQDFAPAIPRTGEPLPREELRWIERNNPARAEAR